MEVEKKNGKGSVIAIIILAILVLALGGYIVYDKVISNKNTETNTEDVNKTNNNSNNTVDQEQTIFKSYNLGDKVNLLDSSNWNVLETSSENDEFVTLLSIDNINTNYNITFTNALSYISTTYKTDLATKLNANSSGIKEARLLTLDDVSKLSGIDVSSLIPGASLENNVTPAFLYQSETITSSVDQDCPIMICSAVPEYYETNPGRICMGTQTNVFPIRPVITISKNYIR